MAEYLKNKQQLALNNENLNKILADLEGLPGGANLNIATQDGVLIGTLTKDTDGFYKMQPAEDPWAEIDAQAGLIEEAIKALENKFIEAGVKIQELFGLTEHSIDSFTRSSRTEINTITVKHSLGKIPKVVIICADLSHTAYVSGDVVFLTAYISDGNVASNGGYYNNGQNGYVKRSSSMNITSVNSNSIGFDTVDYCFSAGCKYSVITMA